MSKLDDETAVYKQQLDAWVSTLGIPDYQPPSTEIDNILSFTRDKLRERSSTQLSEDGVILAQYSLFIQQKVNSCQSFIKWAAQVSNRILGDDKVRLNRWVRLAELRLERIQYLARRIEMVGQSISNLVRARYNERND